MINDHKEFVRSVSRSVVGRRLNEAKARIAEAGLIHRVVSQDGIQFGGTADLVPYRINLEVIDDIVRDAHVG